MASRSYSTCLKNSDRIYWPEGRQVNFYQSIFSFLNKSSTKCLQTSLSQLTEAFGKLLLVFMSIYLHQEISFMPISFTLAAREKDSMTFSLVSLCFLSIISCISLNQSSICFRIILYQSSYTFLFLPISKQMCFTFSSYSSNILRLSQLSLLIWLTEFLLGTTRWSLWIALPQIQFTQSNLNSFSQQSVMKLL